MPWDKLLTLLPQITGSPPAIGAYILLILAGVSLYYRKQQSADLQRLLDSVDRKSANKDILDSLGFEHAFGGNLANKEKFKLRKQQLTVVVALSLIGALTLIALAVVQANKDSVVKQTLLDELTKTSAELQKRLDLEQANRGQLLGDLGVAEGLAKAAGPTAADLVKELRELRNRFSSTVQERFLSKKERDQLVIVDAVLAIAEGNIQLANQLLSRQFLDRLSTDIEVNIKQAVRANIAALAARIRSQDYDGVIECASRILKLRPDNWFALQQWAHALFLKGSLEEAVQKLGEIDVDSKSGGDDWVFPAIDSQTFRELKNPEEWRKTWELSDNVKQSVEDSPYGFSFRYLPLIKSSDYPQSCEQSDRQERQQFARVWLAEDLIRQNRLEDAQLLLKRAVEVCPDYRRALSTHAQNELRLERVLEAESSLDRLAALGPLDAMHTTLLGLTQAQLGKHEEAIATLRKAIELNPGDSRVAIALANAQMEGGQVNETIESLNAFLYQRWDADVALSLADAYGKAGRHDELTKIASKILDNDPMNINMRYNKGLALYKLGNYQGALEDFEQVLLFERNANALFHAALSAGNLGKFQEGLGYADRLIESSPSYRECYFLRAQYLVRLNRFADALSDLDTTKARGEMTDFLDYFYYLVFSGLGDKVKAESHCTALWKQNRIPDQLRGLVPAECASPM